ncbi:MAG: flavodoxin [Catonella sp.]|uniref:flavodoxin n=1 Tax=Catonella sp. TaxID=2382125 RepID=UPI003FA04572
MNILIAYFSRAGENYHNGGVIFLEEGNTEVIARKIAVISGGELFQIKQTVPYSDDYQICVDESKADKAMNARPEIVDCIAGIDAYDIIFLGYPNYWGSLPMCVMTFLEKFDFTGKKIYPFCTHEGSGFGHSIEEIKEICKGAKVESGLSVIGSKVQDYNIAVRNWVENIVK